MPSQKKWVEAVHVQMARYTPPYTEEVMRTWGRSKECLFCKLALSCEMCFYIRLYDKDCMSVGPIFPRQFCLSIERIMKRRAAKRLRWLRDKVLPDLLALPADDLFFTAP